MLVEATAGFGFLAATGFYTFYKRLSAQPEEEPEPEPEVMINLSLIEEFQRTFSEFQYWDLLTNWISVGFYVTAAIVAIWSGVVQPIRSRKKRTRAEMQLTDLIRNESDTESCVGNLSDGLEEPHYTSERECGLDEDQFCEPGIPNMEALTENGDCKLNNQFSQSNLNAQLPKIDVQEVGKSFAIMELEGNPSEKPPASFLSEISDRDKARVEKILKTNTEVIGPNSFADDESNFCTTSLSSSNGRPQASDSNRNSFRTTLAGQQLHQTNIEQDSKSDPNSDNQTNLYSQHPSVPPGGVVLKHTSYGDVIRGDSEEKFLNPNLLTPDTNPKIAKEETTTTTTTTTNSSISSSRSRRSTSRADKPPTGNITRTRLHRSKSVTAGSLTLRLIGSSTGVSPRVLEVFRCVIKTRSRKAPNDTFRFGLQA
ncbi:uncharacterized protein LOC142344980 [Convolutriloba macropyga]|uniref:uncharacterized protein LOC142344980 n=1 Tax=Convolutriloba macropyga TaxID=536237 RepID=UPI003F51D3AC